MECYNAPKTIKGRHNAYVYNENGIGKKIVKLIFFKLSHRFTQKYAVKANIDKDKSRTSLKLICGLKVIP